MAKKLLIENIDNPSVLWQEDVVEGFTDYTTNIVKWDLYGKYVLDIYICKKKIDSLVFLKSNPNYPTIDWSGFATLLTEEEKQVAAKYISAPYTQRLTVVSEEQDKESFELAMNFSRKGRALIIETMRVCVANEVRVENISNDSVKKFIKECSLEIDCYIKANSSDLIDWITNKIETVYEYDGFAQEAYYSEELKTKLVNIYNQ